MARLTGSGRQTRAFSDALLKTLSAAGIGGGSGDDLTRTQWYKEQSNSAESLAENLRSELTIEFDHIGKMLNKSPSIQNAPNVLHQTAIDRKRYKVDQFNAREDVQQYRAMGLGKFFDTVANDQAFAVTTSSKQSFPEGSNVGTLTTTWKIGSAATFDSTRALERKLSGDVVPTNAQENAEEVLGKFTADVHAVVKDTDSKKTLNDADAVGKRATALSQMVQELNKNKAITPAMKGELNEQYSGDLEQITTGWVQSNNRSANMLISDLNKQLNSLTTTQPSYIFPDPKGKPRLWSQYNKQEQVAVQTMQQQIPALQGNLLQGLQEARLKYNAFKVSVGPGFDKEHPAFKSAEIMWKHTEGYIKDQITSLSARLKAIQGGSQEAIQANALEAEAKIKEADNKILQAVVKDENLRILLNLPYEEKVANLKTMASVMISLGYPAITAAKEGTPKDMTIENASAVMHNQELSYGVERSLDRLDTGLTSPATAKLTLTQLAQSSSSVNTLILDIHSEKFINLSNKKKEAKVVQAFDMLLVLEEKKARLEGLQKSPSEQYQKLGNVFMSYHYNLDRFIAAQLSLPVDSAAYKAKKNELLENRSRIRSSVQASNVTWGKVLMEVMDAQNEAQ